MNLTFEQVAYSKPKDVLNWFIKDPNCKIGIAASTEDFGKQQDVITPLELFIMFRADTEAKLLFILADQNGKKIDLGYRSSMSELLYTEMCAVAKRYDLMNFLIEKGAPHGRCFEIMQENVKKTNAELAQKNKSAR